jgi:hypothetical protein
MEEFAVEVDEEAELAFARVAVERITRSRLLPDHAQEAAAAFGAVLAQFAPQRALKAVPSDEIPRPQEARLFEPEDPPQHPILRVLPD